MVLKLSRNAQYGVRVASWDYAMNYPPVNSANEAPFANTNAASSTGTPMVSTGLPTPTFSYMASATGQVEIHV
jgi:hypothetical protein